MKNYIQKYICKSATLFVGASLMLTGCSESFFRSGSSNNV